MKFENKWPLSILGLEPLSFLDKANFLDFLYEWGCYFDHFKAFSSSSRVTSHEIKEITFETSFLSLSSKVKIRLQAFFLFISQK